MTNYFVHTEALCERTARTRPRPPRVVRDRRACALRLPRVRVRVRRTQRA